MCAVPILIKLMIDLIFSLLETFIFTEVLIYPLRSQIALFRGKNVENLKSYKLIVFFDKIKEFTRNQSIWLLRGSFILFLHLSRSDILMNSVRDMMNILAHFYTHLRRKMNCYAISWLLAASLVSFHPPVLRLSLPLTHELFDKRPCDVDSGSKISEKLHEPFQNFRDRIPEVLS